MTTAHPPHTSIEDGIMLDRLIDPMVDAITPLLAEGTNPLPLAEKMATAAAESFHTHAPDDLAPASPESPFPYDDAANITVGMMSDPLYTIDGALFPTINVVTGPDDGCLIESVNPLTKARVVVGLDATGLDSLIDNLAFIRDCQRMK